MPQASIPSGAETASVQVGFEETRCRTGDALQIQLPGSEQRFPARLIGYVPGKSILITAPTNGNQILLLRENQTLTVRSFSGTNAYAYPSQILRAHSTPFAYLHLVWPKSVHKVPIRGSARVDYQITASARNLSQGPDSPPHEVVIVDLSISGAAISASHPLGKKDDQLQLAFSASVHNIPVNPQLQCVIRSAQPGEGGTIRYGLQFLDLALLDTLTLQGLVCEKIFTSR